MKWKERIYSKIVLALYTPLPRKWELLKQTLADTLYQWTKAAEEGLEDEHRRKPVNLTELKYRHSNTLWSNRSHAGGGEITHFSSLTSLFMVSHPDRGTEHQQQNNWFGNRMPAFLTKQGLTYFQAGFKEINLELTIFSQVTETSVILLSNPPCLWRTLNIFESLTSKTRRWITAVSIHSCNKPRFTNKSPQTIMKVRYNGKHLALND